MGCSKSTEADAQLRAENYETRMLELTGIDPTYFGRYYTTIDIDGEEFKVRTITFGDGKDFSLTSDRKPTLLLVHGYLMAGICFFKMIRQLAVHYRLVIIDFGSFGLSDRRQECPVLKEDSDTCEKWIIDYWK